MAVTWKTLVLDDDNRLLPSQTGNSGKFLSTDGTDASWTAIATLTIGDGLNGSNYDGSTNQTISVNVATDSEILSGSSNAIVDAAGLYSAAAPVTLTDGTTITPNFDAGRNFVVTLGGNRTLANPTNQTAGQSGIIIVKKSTTYTLSFGTNWLFSGGEPTLTAGATTDIISYFVETSGTIHCSFLPDMS